MTYLFPERKRQAPKQERAVERFAAEADEEMLPTTLQGKPVDSVEEGRTAIALSNLGWGFIYKKEYFGGRTQPGGVEVDFLVFTPVVLTPMNIKSKYYHELKPRGGIKDIQDAARLAKIAGLAPLLQIPDAGLQSVEQATLTLLAKFGRA